MQSTVLPVWGVPSNQVVLAASLTHYTTGRRLVVATTHLKARSGTLNVMMRAEQGRNLLEWVDTIHHPEEWRFQIFACLNLLLT